MNKMSEARGRKTRKTNLWSTLFAEINYNQKYKTNTQSLKIMSNPTMIYKDVVLGGEAANSIKCNSVTGGCVKHDIRERRGEF